MAAERQKVESHLSPESLAESLRRALERLPSPGFRILRFQRLSAPKLALGLPDDTEDRTAVAALLAALPLVLAAAATSSANAALLAAVLPGVVFASLLLLPVCIFRLQRARVVGDVLTFLVHFLTAARYMNLEGAYRAAVEKLSLRELRRGWAMLVAGEVTDVPSLIERVADELRVYSDQIYLILRSLASEMKKPRPDFEKVLEEATASLRVTLQAEFEAFVSKLGMVSAAVVLIPFTSFLVIPVFIAVIGSSINAAFAATGAVSVLTVAVMMLYLASHLPPHLNIATGDTGCRVTGAMRVSASASAFLALLSPLHPVFSLIAGAAMIAHSRASSCISKFVRGLREELLELPVFLRDLAFEVARGVPLEVALGRGTTCARFRASLASGTAEMPERTFSVVADTLHRLRYSGTPLVHALKALREYISRTLEYRELAQGKLEDARTTIALIYWLLPVTVLASVAVLMYIARELSRMSGLGSFFGFDIGSAMMSTGISLQTALGFATLSVLSCALFSVLLSTVCEDIVHPQIIRVKLADVGKALVLLGAGGIALHVLA